MFNPRERRSGSFVRERRRTMARRKLAVEALEERFLLSNVFQVNLSTDNGTGAAMNSLSWAIDQVNGDSSDTNASPDQIDFSIGGGGPQTIMVTGALPNITRPVLIDGTSQPGLIPSGEEPILIDGSGVTAPGVSGLTLYYGSYGSTVKGLAIGDFNNNGIVLYSGLNTIAGDDIGTNQTGTGALPNSEDGILIFLSSNNTIGGTAAGAGNVISGNALPADDGLNSSNGVGISGAGATGNVVLGNDIGTDSTGENPLPNEYAGVQIDQGASDNTIGGLTAGARNVISSNGIFGVYLDGATDNSVEGNYIGTDAMGTSAMPNGNNGVEILFATNNTIGGTAFGAGNLISGNQDMEVEIQGTGTNDNTVEGNDIGTDYTGTALVVGTGYAGVVIDYGAADNTIGGTIAGRST